MSRPNHCIDAKLIANARIVFREKGFMRASLKEICDLSQVTTGALYKRYSGKGELFYDVVSQTISDLESIVKKKTPVSIKRLSDDELIKAWDMDKEMMEEWFNYLYARKDDIYLLLMCADGTKYRNFESDWVRLMCKSSYAYYQEAYDRNLTDVKLTAEMLHIMQMSFWTSIFRPIVVGFTKEEIAIHNTNMCNLFDWKKLFNFK